MIPTNWYYSTSTTYHFTALPSWNQVANLGDSGFMHLRPRAWGMEILQMLGFFEGHKVTIAKAKMCFCVFLCFLLFLLLLLLLLWWSHRHPQATVLTSNHSEISLMGARCSSLPYIAIDLDGWLFELFWHWQFHATMPGRNKKKKKTDVFLICANLCDEMQVTDLYPCITVGWNKLLMHPSLHFQAPIIDKDIPRANSRLELSIPADTCSRGTVEGVELLLRKYGFCTLVEVRPCSRTVASLLTRQRTVRSTSWKLNKACRWNRAA